MHRLSLSALAQLLVWLLLPMWQPPFWQPAAAPAPDLPESAQVEGMWGYGQLRPLSCEARSAADWARHFGITIRETPFMARMPRSADPNEGFVGSLDGGWGGIPPADYGVHAGPVARVLRQYGAGAEAVHGFSFDRLRQEIAAGRPVVVWVTGHVEPGQRQVYFLNGEEITVARYEHTVIVTGYDKKYVTILDGKSVYQRPVERFLESWGALENMAVIWNEPGAGQGLEIRRRVNPARYGLD